MDELVIPTPNFPARVRAGSGSGDSLEALLALAREAAPDPTIFEEHDPYFWAASISTDRVDSYFTRMEDSTLRNFETGANEGVAFLTGHDTKRLPMGRSIQGKYTKKRGEGNSKVEADFYTLRGMNTNGVTTDDFIMGVRSGVVSDVSVGFHGGQFICNICERDMMDWDWSDWENNCMHIPGVEYELTNKKGEPTGVRKLCIAAIENANLSEVSGVYDGATPGASITKARMLVESGKIPTAKARMIEAHYGNRFRIVPEPIWTGHTINRASAAEEDSIVSDLKPIAEAEDAAVLEDETRDAEVVENVGDAVEDAKDAANDAADDAAEEVEDVAENVEDAAEEAAEDANDAADDVADDVNDANEETRATGDGDDDMAVIEELRSLVAASGVSDLSDDPIEAVRQINTELARLRPLADDGRTYRSDLISEALTEGERAFGEKFQREQREALLNKLDTADIKAMRDDWRSVADKTFIPGAVTVEEEADEVEAEYTTVPGRDRGQDKRNLPLSAYKS